MPGPFDCATALTWSGAQPVHLLAARRAHYERQLSTHTDTRQAVEKGRLETALFPGRAVPSPCRRYLGLR
jgi:hypothetical protein